MPRTKPQHASQKSAAKPAAGFDFSKLSGNHYVNVAILALLCAGLFGAFLFSDKMLYGSDQFAGFASHVVLRDALVEHGQFPMWLPSHLGGMPTIDAMFGDAMYIPSLIMYVLFDMHRALGHIMVLHVFLAGLFFYILLVRGFGAPPLAGLAGGALYMFNPEFVSHVYPGHPGKMMVIAWLPFVIWRMKVLMERPGPRNMSLLTLGIAACLFTSHTQMTYFVIWGLVLYWLLTLVLEYVARRDIKRLVPHAAYFALAGLCGVGMAFIQFYPSFAFINDAHSVRGVERGFEYAASWSLHWPEFFSLWVPEFGSYLENYWSENPFKLNTEYAGAIALLFAVFAVALKPRPWRIFWAAGGALAVLYGMGAHTPVFHVAYYLLPGVKKFRAGSMMLFWYSFSVVLLASLFFADVIRGELASMDDSRKKKWQRGILIALGAITGCALLFSTKGFVASLMRGVLADTRKNRIFELNFSENFVPALWMWWVMASASIGLLWGVLLGKVNRYVFLAAVLAIGLFDVMRVDSTFIKAVNPNKYLPSSPVLDRLREQMADAPFRCFSLPGTLPENALGIHGLEGIGGFHDNELQWYRDFRGDQRNTNYFHGILSQDAQGRAYLNASQLPQGNAFLNIANVRYYLAGQGGQIVPIENKGALGRLSFVPSYVVVPKEEITASLRTGAYDYHAAVALLEEPSHKPPPLAADTTDSAASLPVAQVQWKEYTPNVRKARVTVPREGFLRVSEVYYPGWEIRIDGNPARIYQADLAWMAVYVDAGEHDIVMMPKSMYLGTASVISLPLIAAALIYWIVIALLGLRKKQEN
ncbi:MAG: hypothetical protein GF418_01885 [Chitinivibrionales bacterium]|nr:hypothetical protein [Chitinivibrionales bacterium]MBD3394350.1 hypothetical protein [Chitinivibrionales bacterium]